MEDLIAWLSLMILAEFKNMDIIEFCVQRQVEGKSDEGVFKLGAIRSEDQAVLEELERLKRQEKEANDAAEVLRKEFAQSTEDLLLQAGATRLPNPNDWLLVTPKTSHHNCCKKSLGNLTTRRLSISRAGDLCHGNARSRHHKLLLTIEAEYVAAANCYGQVLRIQNHIIVKHPMFTLLNKAVQNKAMRIRHHYIRDAYERRLIPSADDSHYDNVADLLTKAFDVSSSISYCNIK
ncbi:hypothetical protein Tco_0268138 [Tanacetum coccineum]